MLTDAGLAVIAFASILGILGLLLLFKSPKLPPTRPPGMTGRVYESGREGSSLLMFLVIVISAGMFFVGITLIGLDHIL